MKAAARDLATLGGLLVCLTGCFSDRPTEPTGPTVSFAADVQPVLSGSCAFSGCHGPTRANPGAKPMVLAEGQAYDNIVGVSAAEAPAMQRIQPGQPDASYLIHKLQGTHLTVGGSGSQMPLGGAPLSKATIDRLRAWVAAGALRN